MHTFSTIIPCFNRQEYIAAAIDSVIAQSEACEIIVVDDGSTDDSLRVLERYAARITILRQQNRGPGTARNLGASRATGEYVCFLDSDDVWFPWTLRTYRQLIETHGRPAVIATESLVFTDDATLQSAREEPLVSSVYRDFLAMPTSWFQPSGMAIRRDIFGQVGGFTESHCEDADFWLRLGIAPGFVAATSPKCFGYRFHPGGISNSQSVKAEIERLIDEECAGHYPGGAARQFKRRAYISMHIRTISLYCLKGGLPGRAMRLYRRTFWWNVQLGRWKFIFLLPPLAVASLLRRASSARPGR